MDKSIWKFRILKIETCKLWFLVFQNHHFILSVQGHLSDIICEFRGEFLLHIDIVMVNGANSIWWNHSWALILVLADISSDKANIITLIYLYLEPFNVLIEAFWEILMGPHLHAAQKTGTAQSIISTNVGNKITGLR